jgi:hypothetical protein
MSEGDIFREVEEDLRREQLARAWDRYGAYILAVAFVIVALAIGYNIQKWRSTEQAAEGGEALTRAVNLLDEGKSEEANKLLQDLASRGRGNYPTLARLQLAAESVRDKNTQAALEHYRAVADDATAERDFRDFARVQAAALEIGTLSYDDMQSRLGGLAGGNSPFRFSARELIALSAMRTGNVADAEKRFGELLGDGESPAQMRQRAEIMLSLLVRRGESAAAQPQGGAQNEARSQ